MSRPLSAKRWQQGGLYAITDATLTPAATLCEQVAAVLNGGAVMIQYRDKETPTPQRRQQAAALVKLCEARQTPLIINDDLELAAAVGAAGVHLGRDDSDIATARARLGADAIIGVSCYNRLDLAVAAAAAGADYLAFGSFYPSATKPQAVRATSELLSHARAQFDLPLVAIGGINAENGRPLMAAGADLLAVITALFANPDPEAAARAFAYLNPNKSP
ncbi:MAG: thiamine phosphate synthase [Gammaproteobacteria bacterium]|nr:thiamine phosphate synthase [Gammaproteobacteria bacterium]